MTLTFGGKIKFDITKYWISKYLLVAITFWNVHLGQNMHQWVNITVNLTFRSRSNVTSPLNFSSSVSYWWSIHSEWLSSTDKLLWAN